MRFAIDIDETICTYTDGQYELAEPIPETIAVVNRLYDEGHSIVFFTARGSGTGIDWYDTTVEQLHKWGVKYSELMFGKPWADYYVDDRCMPIEDFLRLGGDDF